MENALGAAILDRISAAISLYHHLVLVVAPMGAGKSSALEFVSEQSGCRVVNLSLELSERMLDLTQRQRTLQLPRLLDGLIDRSPESVVLLDNIELLFEPSLMQDPLRLLQGASRQKTLVAAWGGTIIDGWLTYAAQGHPEYKKYPIEDLLIVGGQYNA